MDGEASPCTSRIPAHRTIEVMIAANAEATIKGTTTRRASPTVTCLLRVNAESGIPTVPPDTNRRRSSAEGLILFYEDSSDRD